MPNLEQAAREEMDREILYFVRGMEAQAPVTVESLLAYLRNHCRRRCTESELADRLAYMEAEDSRYLKKIVEWDRGEITRYEITALGMDLLDGNDPHRNWRPK